MILKPVPGFDEELYASDEGLIYSKDPQAGTISEVKSIESPQGYRTVRAKIAGKSTPRLVHRLVASAWHRESAGAGNVVRHLDHDKQNNRPENLAYGTAADNKDDQIRAGRVLKGEEHPNAKLTQADVANLRFAVQFGVTQREMAEHFGVDFRTISNVVTGRRWRIDPPAGQSPNP